MASNERIDKDDNGVEIDSTKYGGTIGSLLYLNTNRPYIMFSVCMCVRFQASPRESPFKIIKRYLRYLNGTSHLNIWFPRGSEYNLVGVSYFDFAGGNLDRKRTNDTCYLFVNYLVSWHNKKQHNVVLSTVDAEYVATSNCCAQVIWLKQQLLDEELKLDHIPIKCDNTSIISLNNNHVLNI